MPLDLDVRLAAELPGPGAVRQLSPSYALRLCVRSNINSAG